VRAFGVCQNLAGKRLFILTLSSLRPLRNPLRILRLKKNIYRVGGKNYQRTNRARCGSTGASAPGSANFLTAGAVTAKGAKNCKFWKLEGLPLREGRHKRCRQSRKMLCFFAFYQTWVIIVFPLSLIAL